MCPLKAVWLFLLMTEYIFQLVSNKNDTILTSFAQLKISVQRNLVSVLVVPQTNSTPQPIYVSSVFAEAENVSIMWQLFVVPITSTSPGCVIFYWNLPFRCGWWRRGPLLLLLPPLLVEGRRGGSGREEAGRSGRKGGKATPFTRGIGA